MATIYEIIEMLGKFFVRYKKNDDWKYVKRVGDVPQEFRSRGEAQDEIKRMKESNKGQDYRKEFGDKKK